MGTIDNDWDEEYSVIGDKVEVDFLDFEDDKSLHNFNLEEGPVVITKPFPFVNGKPQSALVGETSADSIDIRNTSAEPVELWSIRIFSANPEDSYILSVIKPPTSDADVEAARRFVGSDALEDTVIQPGRTFKIWLSCKPKEIGLHTGIVHFDLGDEKVERVAFLLADDTVSQSLNSSKPYSRAPSRTRKPISEEFVSGNRPARATTHVFRNKLPQFRIPLSIREIVESKQVPDVIMEGLNDKNYSRYFSMLIAMEEIHLEQEMRAHDMECVSMRRKGYFFLALVVPGLAEKRPSLVPGDYIFVQNVNEDLGDATRQYQGYIHRVEADEICLKFDRELHFRHQDTDLYNVSFTYNRINMRRLYQAVQAAENLGSELLFPSESSDARVIKTSSFVPLNPNLNDEQARSVEMILGCKGGPPYVIYGPPGTGKTMTMIEAILQIYTTRKDARLLICASSNSAADHVLEKLLSIENVDIKCNEIFRLNAPSRAYDDMKSDFIRFCYFEDMVFACPPLKALLRYRIIISTYMSASLLYAEGIRRGHFSEIFLDEAGQASEPETMVPISNLCVKNTLIVLAGDPKQLGPVIYSRTAESYGMGKSYLDRLFECEYYGRGNENYVTKLVKNYRCHPAILELPSKLFYNNELIACKEDSDSSLYDSFDIPNKAFPVYFVGIQGCDEREGSNPSWFNRIEASKVTEIIKKLIMCADLDENDVGVITPYRQQVLKIKKALESVEILDVKVGSVEQFQGQERKVIIISTVRSTVKHNEFDRVHNLGFLSNPRRFNVAITRARSLLIIVGNPHIIAKDPNWDKLLRYCADNGSYQGCPLPEPENHYYANEARGYDGDQQIPIPHSDGAEWGDPNQHNTGAEWDDVPKQYTNDVEWDDDTHNQYTNEERGDATAQTYSDGPKQGNTRPSNDHGWGDDTHNQYNNEERGDATAQTYSDGPKQGNTRPSNDHGWGGDTHNQYNNEEWGDATAQTYSSGPKRGNTRPYSSDHGWGGDTHNQYNNEEWGDATAQTYSGGPKRGNTRPYSSDHGWGGDTHNQYNNEEWGDATAQTYSGGPKQGNTRPYSKDHGWGGDNSQSYNNAGEMDGDGLWKDYPEEQSKEWDVPPGSGWDAVPYEEPSRSTKLPPPHISHATGWDDVPYVEPSSSTKLPPPHISHVTGWDDVPYEEHSSSTKLPPPHISHTSSRISHATGWGDVPYERPSSSTKRRPSRNSRATGWDN